jgi:hypothetical protein
VALAALAVQVGLADLVLVVSAVQAVAVGLAVLADMGRADNMVGDLSQSDRIHL